MSSFFLAQEVGQVIRAASDCVHRVGSFRLLPGIPLVSQHRLLAHYYAGVSGLCSPLAPLSSSFPQESLEAKFLEPNKNGLLRVQCTALLHHARCSKLFYQKPPPLCCYTVKSAGDKKTFLPSLTILSIP